MNSETKFRNFFGVMYHNFDYLTLSKAFLKQHKTILTWNFLAIQTEEKISITHSILYHFLDMENSAMVQYFPTRVDLDSQIFRQSNNTTPQLKQAFGISQFFHLFRIFGVSILFKAISTPCSRITDAA